jgi:hypothetical protein
MNDEKISLLANGAEALSVNGPQFSVARQHSIWGILFIMLGRLRAAAVQ